MDDPLKGCRTYDDKAHLDRIILEAIEELRPPDLAVPYKLPKTALPGDENKTGSKRARNDDGDAEYESDDGERPPKKIRTDGRDKDGDGDNTNNDTDDTDVEMTEAKSSVRAFGNKKVKKTSSGTVNGIKAPSKSNNAQQGNHITVLSPAGIGNRFLDPTRPPLSDLDSIYNHIAEKTSHLHNQEGFSDFSIEKLADHLQNRPIRIVTMCSGTEAPILALRMIQEAFQRLGVKIFQIDHLASAEIEPFKQAYIHRNFEVPIIFKDVTDFLKPGPARTAYGGTADLPSDVHVLIAGSSCIDYSTLNKNRKDDYEPQGESFDTMEGVRAYAKERRPNIVILENIKGAPWSKIQDIWRQIDYDVRVVRVDTKNYYLPQTRERGYLIGFDTRRAQQMNFDTNHAKDLWVMLMAYFQQRATSPFTDFIYPDDHPEVQLFKESPRYAKSINPTKKNVDWCACWQRYQKHRVSLHLGIERPMTFWKPTGNCRFPDFGWRYWADTQRQRIWETLDINYLVAGGIRNYDLLFKSRSLELSQNVDRDQDTRAWGFVGCVTPTGQPFLTTRCGLISGREVLALQGMPLESMILPLENNRMLQDFAGNAMTTTVVGCAAWSALLLSSIIATQSKSTPFLMDVSHCYQNGDSTMDEPNLASLTEEEIIQEPQILQLHKDLVPLSGSRPADLTHLRYLASVTDQLCHCEGFLRTRTTPILICRECGHTACKFCAVNPAHKYSASDVVMKERKHPRVFLAEITAVLPQAFDLSRAGFPFDTSLSDDFEEDTCKKYQAAVSRALDRPLCLQDIKREGGWGAVYESHNARLELRLTRRRRCPTEMLQIRWPGSMTCTWVLFAKPAADEPSASVVRELLQRPIAQMQPETSLFQGLWQILSPNPREVKLSIFGHGEKVKSWKNSLGLPKYHNELRYSMLQINSGSSDPGTQTALKGICGNYKLLPNCGTAESSLYRRIADADSIAGSSTFFFLDPHPLGEPNSDKMTFSQDPRRLCRGVTRLRIADIEERFRPTEDRMGRRWRCYVFENSGSFPYQMEPYDSNFSRWAAELSDLTIDCNNHTHDSGSTILLLSLPFQTENTLWEDGVQCSLKLQDQRTTLKEYAWLLKSAGRISQVDKWHNVSLVGPSVICSRCYPPLPGFVWELRRTRKGQTATVMPKENVTEATAFEKALRDRPAPLTAVIHRKQDTALLQISMNLAPLVMAVLARLMGQGAAPLGPIHLQWRIAQEQTVARAIRVRSAQIKSNSLDVPWRNPSRTSTNDEDNSTPTHFKRGLWKTQAKTLNWMISRETEPTKWREIDREEFNAPSLGWRLEVVGEKEVCVRGGVLADEVGAGKTTTSLALVAATITDDIPAVNFKAEGIIRCKGTLILVPSSILRQWGDELKACMDLKAIQAISIGTTDHLRSLTIKEVVDADVILAPYDMFDKDMYWSWLRSLCHAKYIPPKAGRGFQNWLIDALDDLKEFMRGWENDDLEDTQKMELLKRAEGRGSKYEKYHGFSKPAEDKLNSTTGDAGSVSTQAAEKKPERLEKIPLLLHMFHFKRLIVDEFTYLDGKALLAILKLKADRKWILSGTPPIHDFDSINTMAQLIGTKISSHNDDDGIFSFIREKSRIANDKTYAEEFRALQVVRSEHFTNRRDEDGVRWLREFARQNAAMTPDDELEAHHHFMVCGFTPEEQIAYSSVCHYVFNNSIKFGPTTSKANQPETEQNKDDFETRMKLFVASSSSIEDALICSYQIVKLPDGSTPDIPPLDDPWWWDGSVEIDYMRRTPPTPGFFEKDIEAKQAALIDLIYDLSRAFREAFGFLAMRDELEGEDEANLFTIFQQIASNQLDDKIICEGLSSILAWASRKSQWLVPSVRYAGSERHGEGQDTAQNLDQPMGPTEVIKKKGVAARAVVLSEKVAAVMQLFKQIQFYRAVDRAVRNYTIGICMDCGELQRAYAWASIAINCGHVICDTCRRKRTKRKHDGTCGSDGCGSSALSEELIDNRRLKRRFMWPQNEQGSKMSALVRKLHQILDGYHLNTDGKTDDEADLEREEYLDAGGDYIVIFVQFDRHRADLVKMLTRHQIQFTDATTGAKGAVDRFKDGKGGNVCVLRIDSVDAAGW